MSVLREIFTGRSNIDFRPKWRIGLAVSAFLVVASILLLLLRGLNLSIDFEGGGIWEAPVPEDVSVAEARDAVSAAGADARFTVVNTSSSRLMQVQAGSAALENSDEIAEQLAALGEVSTDDVNVSQIGPTWGDQITSKAVRALIFFFIAVAFYLAWRLEWRMAVGAVAAVVHDLVIVAGVYSLFGFEVSPATVIALLTILGYSLYDTVVVYDKVLENDRGLLGERLEPGELVSASMNQVLMRSINTTITTVLPVLSMLVIGGFLLGGTGLQDFALALFIGLISGTYSSIFIAAPLLVWLKEREPEARRAAAIEARRKARLARSGSEDIDDEVEGVVAGAGGATPLSTDGYDTRLVTPGGGPPRPRKKGRRR
ncbi:MAG: protein translocase subunit SecF [Acidimicrobiia bacterium]|nr:protein translocase subunit SecF [Acidimicrobiia bacterium]